MIEKRKEFIVPINLMVEFADIISDWGFACDITGTSKNKEIIVQVSYDQTNEGRGITELKELMKRKNEEE